MWGLVTRPGPSLEAGVAIAAPAYFMYASSPAIAPSCVIQNRNDQRMIYTRIVASSLVTSTRRAEIS